MSKTMFLHRGPVDAMAGDLQQLIHGSHELIYTQRGKHRSLVEARRSFQGIDLAFV